MEKFDILHPSSEQPVSHGFFSVIRLRSSYIQTLTQGRGFTVNSEAVLVQVGPTYQADHPTCWTHSKPLWKSWVIVVTLRPIWFRKTTGYTPSERSSYFSKTHQAWEFGEREGFQNHFGGSHMEGSSSRSQEVSHQEWGLAKLCYAHLLRAVWYLFLSLYFSFENLRLV